VRANACPAGRDRAATELYCGSELVPEARDRGTWDGGVLPYVPAPFGDEVAGLPLSREYDTDIDPVSYQVLRWRLWNINLEHDDTIRRVCGTSIVCHALDYNTSMLAEDGRTVLGGPSLAARDEIFNVTNGDVFRWEPAGTRMGSSGRPSWPRAGAAGGTRRLAVRRRHARDAVRPDHEHHQDQASGLRRQRRHVSGALRRLAATPPHPAAVSC
jgi:hypothetical protein